MTLDRLLKQRIRTTGPITIAELMVEALGNKHYGYYTTHDPLGAQGDFTTAPEISQLFGEVIGIWCAYSWQRMGCPPAFSLVELGPGRGTLMKDLLRATRHITGFHEALTVHLVEISPVLRKKQQQSLAGYPVYFHDSFSSVPDGPFLLVANEFFDALPIHQYVKTTGGWQEKRVGIHPEGNGLCFLLQPVPTALHHYLSQHYPDAPDNAVIETCPAGINIMREIATRLRADAGAALVIDYGYDREGHYDNTLQAVRCHRYHPVLENVGEADITAHVDFSALKQAAVGVSASILTQQTLLETFGIHTRAEMLMKNANPIQREAIMSGLERLISPNAMGTLFKAMILPNQDIP